MRRSTGRRHQRAPRLGQCELNALGRLQHVSKTSVEPGGPARQVRTEPGVEAPGFPSEPEKGVRRRMVAKPRLPGSNSFSRSRILVRWPAPRRLYRSVPPTSSLIRPGLVTGGWSHCETSPHEPTCAGCLRSASLRSGGQPTDTTAGAEQLAQIRVEEEAEGVLKSRFSFAGAWPRSTTLENMVFL